MRVAQGRTGEAVSPLPDNRQTIVIKSDVEALVIKSDVEAFDLPTLLVGRVELGPPSLQIMLALSATFRNRSADAKPPQTASQLRPTKTLVRSELAGARRTSVEVSRKT
jgi:hypothetical protein